MKKIIVPSIAAVLMIAVYLPAFSQTYKRVADTAALNTEYMKVTRDIADLNVKLDKAKSDQAMDLKKSNDANADAQSTASSTSNKAAESVDGSVKQAKKAKREARRSVRDAKDARNAEGNLDDSNKKVSKLTEDLEKKQKRLKELDGMRASINGTPQ